MPERRTSGSGSVYAYQRNGRTYYRATLELIAGGRRHRKTFAAKTKLGALRKMQQWRKENPNPHVDLTRLTLAAYLTQWLEGRDMDLRPSSLERYRQAIARLPDDLTAQQLAKVEPSDLEAAYRVLRASGMAPAGVLKVHRVLHVALQDAMLRGLALRNAAALVHSPRVPRTEVQTITAQQVVALIAAARGDRFEALYLLACMTGMRQGELLALRWQDIDWDAPAVMVRGGARGGARTETKTGRERRVMIVQSMANALRVHRERQDAERAQARRWYNLDLIFALPDGRMCDRGWFSRSSWYPVRERAGIGPLAFKDATRHAAASLLVAAGVQPRIIADILGHSQIAITMDRYSHVLPGMQADAAAAMERLLLGEV